jgi:hypothetical protein
MITKKIVVNIFLFLLVAFVIMEIIKFLAILIFPLLFLIKIIFWLVVIYIIGYILFKKFNK